MSKYHDHRSDCPFKFAPLDVCDCVEHNMLDHIEQLVAANKSLIKELNTCRMAQAVMDNTVAELEKQCEGLMQAGMNNGQALILAEAKLAKAVEALRNIAVVGFSSDPSVNAAIAKQTVMQARAVLAEIEGEKG